MNTPVVELFDVHKSYSNRVALKPIRLRVEAGEMVCVIGPSGGGKTTLLQLIAALVEADGGSIHRFGSQLNYQTRWPNDVRIGYVFQDSRLFPHLSAIDNCTLGLEHVRNLSKRTARQLSEASLAELEVLDVALSFPHQLSGGQRQRVAIARALVMEPSLLLLDEVTASLDPENIANLLDVIDSYHERSGCTCILNTHHIGFARNSSTRLLFLDRGTVLASGPTDTFFETDWGPTVSKFLASLDRL